MRKSEWVFVTFFVASGFYCLAVVAGLITFRLPLPDWLKGLGTYLFPYRSIFIAWHSN